MARRLQSFFRPQSVVLVGATERSNWSNAVVGNLRSCGYGGKLFLVNPRGGSAYGMAVHTSVREIHEPVDLAYLMVPVAAMDDALADLAAAGITQAIVLTSGFAEAGEEGVRQQHRLQDKARAHGVALIGPNCLGYINQVDNIPLWSIALPSPMILGTLAIVSQSGATAALMAFFAAQQGIGFSHLVSTGNEVDVDIAAVVDHLVDEPQTRAIALFVETVRHPERLAAAAARAHAAKKPIVVMKIGASEGAARSAQAHTGALVGNDRVFDAACKRLGLVRVQSIEDAVFTAETITRLGPVDGKLGFASMSGGFSEIAADRAHAEGVPLATLAAGTVARLKDILPGFGTPHNPLDTTGAVMLDPGIMARALGALADDPQVGVIAVSYDVPTHAGEDNPFRRALVAQVLDTMARCPLPSVLFSYTMRPVNDYARRLLGSPGAQAHYIACGAHHGITALRGAFAWSEHMRRPRRAPVAIVRSTARPATKQATLGYLAAAGVPVAPHALAGSAELDVPMREGGIELFVGSWRDPQWGPVLALGLGGVWVEVLNDTSLRLLPVTPADVLDMLGELRGTALLDGHRGSPAADRQRLAEVVAAIGNAALALGPALVSLEVNPLRVQGSDCEALDALAVWDASAATPGSAHAAATAQLVTT